MRLIDVTVTLVPFNSPIYPPFPAADTAQAYRNEAEAGQAIRESGLARDDIFVTTKYSGLGGLDIETSIQDSLRKVSLSLLYGVAFCFSTKSLWSSTDDEDLSDVVS